MFSTHRTSHITHYEIFQFRHRQEFKTDAEEWINMTNDSAMVFLLLTNILIMLSIRQKAHTHTTQVRVRRRNDQTVTMMMAFDDR